MMKKLVVIFCCLLGVLSACRKADSSPEPQEHPFTEEELVKRHLDQSFSAFVTAMDLDSTITKDPKQFIMDNSSVSIDLTDRGALVYELKRHLKTVLEARFYPLTGEVSSSLYGGISIRGTIKPALSLKWEDWEKKWDLDVYDEGKAVAKLGVEPGLSTFVFRFPDGTSYAVSSLLISEALLDYLIENVLSTE